MIFVAYDDGVQVLSLVSFPPSALARGLFTLRHASDSLKRAGGRSSSHKAIFYFYFADASASSSCFLQKPHPAPHPFHINHRYLFLLSSFGSCQDRSDYQRYVSQAFPFLKDALCRTSSNLAGFSSLSSSALPSSWAKAPSPLHSLLQSSETSKVIGS